MKRKLVACPGFVFQGGGGKAGQLQVLLLAQTGALWACGKLALEVREGWRCQALGAH